MKVATTYKEVWALFREAYRGVIMGGPTIGIDIGKQFGLRMVIHLDRPNAVKLLSELEVRDLPCPQVIWTNDRILIGVEPQ
jgi:hypothetical protein